MNTHVVTDLLALVLYFLHVHSLSQCCPFHWLFVVTAARISCHYIFNPWLSVKNFKKVKKGIAHLSSKPCGAVITVADLIIKKKLKITKKHETLKHCNFEHQFLLLLLLQVSSIKTSFRSPKAHIPEACFIKCVPVVDNVPNPAVFIRFSVTKITLFSLFFVIISYVQR